jgi:hypothetical protein
MYKELGSQYFIHKALLIISRLAFESPVLPGPEKAFPPFEQKSSVIWRKHTVISNFSKIPLIFRYVWPFTPYYMI